MCIVPVPQVTANLGYIVMVHQIYFALAFYCCAGGADIGSFTMETILAGIHYFRCHNHTELLATVHLLTSFVQKHPKVSRLLCPWPFDVGRLLVWAERKSGLESWCVFVRGLF